jgi:hypothetical protein
MKKIYGISFIILLWLFSGNPAFTQDKEEENSKTIKKEVKVTIDDENGDQKYTVETTTTENGQKKVVKKTYSSLEEMQSDESLGVISSTDEAGNITMKLGAKGSGVMVNTSEESETVDIKIDQISEELEWVQTEEDGHKITKSSGGKMIFIKDDEDGSGNTFSFMTENGDSNHIVKRYEVKVIKDGEEADHKIHEHKNVFIIKDEDGNISMGHDAADDVLVWIDEEGNRSIKKSYHIKSGKTAFSEARIEPVSDGDEALSLFNLSGMPELVMKSINYYPNPNGGEFTLAFTGSKKPVILRILDMKGNMKMEKNIKNFDGTFNQVLNIKHYDKGTYLMQIFQQDKVLNRKLILE